MFPAVAPTYNGTMKTTARHARKAAAGWGCTGKGGGLRVGIYRCPACGAEVRMFPDEPAVTCSECGGVVERGAAPCCVEWCSAFRGCSAVPKAPEPARSTVESKEE